MDGSRPKSAAQAAHTAMRIYHRLEEELGYGGSYSSVRRYVSKKKLVMKLAVEGYLPLAQTGGHGQVDFGESLYYDGQENERKGYALTVSFPQSDKGYTQFFPSQKQECLLTGLQRIFEHIGGYHPSCGLITCLLRWPRRWKGQNGY